MNPRRRHRATSFSISMTLLPSTPVRGLLQPVTLGNAHRPDLDTQRVAAQLRHQGELIHLRRRPDVVIISQLPQDCPALADLQRPLQDAAVVLEAVPRQPGTV